MALFRWVLVGVAFCAMPSAAADFSPHRAIYDFRPQSIRQGTPLSSARGVLTYEFQDACDGWLVDSRLDLEFSFMEGGQGKTSIAHLSWEAKDGQNFNFRQRITQDNEVIEDIEGTAKLNKNGGKVTFTRPQESSQHLPAGTLFPVSMMTSVLKAAQQGKAHLVAPIFDGGEVGEIKTVSVLVGKAIAPAADTGNELLKVPSYPVRVAYFEPSKGGDDGMPTQEVSTDFFTNGVSSRMEFDVEGVRLKGRLREVIPMERNPC